MFYFVYHFAKHTVYRSYLIDSQKRIGFQVHNIFGDPGKKYEMTIGNAKFLSKKQELDVKYDLEHVNSHKTSENKLFRSSYIPIKVPKLNGNLLIDKRGLETSQQLVELLSHGEELLVSQSKEERVQWRKKQHPHQKHRQLGTSSTENPTKL
jgi:hypothetical protein